MGISHRCETHTGVRFQPGVHSFWIEVQCRIYMSQRSEFRTGVKSHPIFSNRCEISHRGEIIAQCGKTSATKCWFFEKKEIYEKKTISVRWRRSRKKRGTEAEDFSHFFAPSPNLLAPSFLVLGVESRNLSLCRNVTIIAWGWNVTRHLECT